MSPSKNEPIAVIGSGCRFPGGCSSPSKLWELLKDPKDILKTIPEDRFNVDAFFHPEATHHGTTNVKHSYFLDENVAHFDTNLFNIPPKEAEVVDPQHRILLETVYDSLCDAGLPLDGLRGSDTAVYVGQMCDDWATMLQKDPEAMPTYTGTGSARSILSNRVSYCFDWHGPSMTIDTACSSSLVCVDLAVKTLRAGESTVAIAAGANLILNPGQYVAESNLRMLSPTGRSRMWDSAADGYARGEGIAAVVLKTLSQAIKDGDSIECIIRETGVNQDGKTGGITVPSNIAQTALIRETYRRAGLDLTKPSDRPQFFHAHGTGTKAGDPQEAEAIHNAFFNNFSAPHEKLFVGSIKTVIGHTEGTAGLASLIGTSLALRNKTIPPNMHFNNLNPDIAPYYSNLEVPVKAKQWAAPADGGVRRASINNFGFGGTNSHAILEEYIPEQATPKASPAGAVLSTPLVFSANTAASLKQTLSDHLDFLNENSDVSLRDLAWTLQHKRTTLPFRKAINARDYKTIIGSLKEIVEAKDAKLDTRYGNAEEPKILGVFTGQGAQWARMGAELIETSAFASQRIDDLNRALSSLPDADRPTWNIREQLLAGADVSRITEAFLSQPLCTAVQVVLVDLLRSAGIRLEAVVGHSSGEIGAAYASGLLTDRDAIRIAYYRGLHAKLAASPNGAKGAMAAVGCSHGEAENLCNREEMQGRLSVAAYNSASSLTISGDEAAVDEAIEEFKNEQKFARKLKVDTAYHSAHMQPCAGPYVDSLDSCGIEIRNAPLEDRPTWYSSVYDDYDRAMDAERLNNDYWVKNMVQPVLFSSAVTAAAESAGGFDLAIEFGPHPALKGPAMDNLAEAGITGLPYTGLLSRGKNDVQEVINALGFMWSTLGSGSVNFDTFDRTFNVDHDSVRTLVSGLPSYPFNHTHAYWGESRLSIQYRKVKVAQNPVLGARIASTTTASEVQWKNFLRPKEVHWMSGHKLHEQIIFPATGYIAMAIEAMKAIAATAGNNEISHYRISNLSLERAMAFNDDNSSIETLFSVKIQRSDNDRISADFGCYSTPEGGDGSMITNARGRAEVIFGEASPNALPYIPSANKFNLVDVNPEKFYSSLRKIGYHYSEPFQGISDIKRKMGCAFGTLKDQAASEWEDNLVIHPGMLDTALQTCFNALCYPEDESLRALHVPVGIESIVVNPYFSVTEGRRQETVQWESGVRDDIKSSIEAHVQLLSQDGQHTFVQMEGLTLKPFSPARPEDDTTIFSHLTYITDQPDGELAAEGHSLTEAELDVARDVERIAFFYLRRVSVLTDDDLKNALPHFKYLRQWAKYIVEKVRSGGHGYVAPESINDKEEEILKLIQKHKDCVDVKLVAAVGQNLPSTLKSGESILQHMSKDDVLPRFYADGIGLRNANLWIGNYMKQISHRYAHMKILEVGAGTGGTTQTILPALGTSFSTYTYTDVSAGFFETAEKKFKDYAGRMIFKVFDMAKEPSSQGFEEGTYDMIVAANVLHIADPMDNMAANVRRLLKPGGYLVNLETVNNDVLRNGIIMGCLPGWWIGAESDRPHGPMLTLDQWDSLLKRNGFGGLCTSTPVYDKVHAVAVWAAQAVDERVKLLQNPADINPTSVASAANAAPPPPLIVVGGQSLAAYELTEKVVSLVSPKFPSFEHLASIEDLTPESIPEGATVLSLAELDEPLMREVTDAKINGLKALYAQARTIVWVSHGARCEQPHSYMMFGIGRVCRFEYPNINLQMVDIDTINEESGEYVANTLLRHQLLDSWRKEGGLDGLLWSNEPELYLENGKSMVTRLYNNKTQNLRANASRRVIYQEVDAAKTTIKLSEELEVEEVTDLEKSVQEKQAGETVRVKQSLLQYINIPSVGTVAVVVGAKENGSSVLALTNLAQSPAPIEIEATISIPPKKEFGHMALLTLAANLVAQNILSQIPSEGGSLLIHEPDKILKTAISRKAAKSNTRVVFTTSQAEKKSGDWILVHPTLPLRDIKRYIPQDIAVFVDLSAENTASAEAAARIAKYLPRQAKTIGSAVVFGDEPALKAGASLAQAKDILKTAWKDATSASVAIDYKNAISVNNASEYKATEGPLKVVDWSSEVVKARVRPVDHNTIFRADATYLLIGLSGEVGQSLCRWMVQHGARHVVLSSRRPVVAPEFINSIEEKGAEVRVMSLDITNRDNLNRCIKEINRTMPRIAGIANGAFVNGDRRFDTMDLEGMMMVLRAKVDGTIMLDEVFHDTPLDFFIMFSSITAVFGNSGQSNYAAANLFMTALAAQRRKRGVAGSVIALSSLIGIGHVSKSEHLTAEYFTSLGATNVSEGDVHIMFAEAIDAGKPGSKESHEVITGVSPLYEDEIANKKLPYRSDIKFDHVAMERYGDSGDQASASTVSVKTQLKSVKTLAQLTEVLLTSFTARVKKVLQVPADDVMDPNVALVEHGVDSLVALDIRTWFVRELDVDMPVLKILGGNSIADLVNNCIEKLPKSVCDVSALSTDNAAAAPAPAAAAPAAPAPKPEAKKTVEVVAPVPKSGLTPPAGSLEVSRANTPSASSDNASETDDTSVDSEDPRDAIVRISKETTERMSFGQTRFWFLHHALQDKTTFNIALKFHLRGKIDVAKLSAAVQAVAEKHEAMRTRYFWSGNNMDVATQGVLSRPLVKLEHRRITNESEATQALEAMRDHRWDLNDWEAMKFELLSLGDRHWLVFGGHHITFDGLGIHLIVTDLEMSYRGMKLEPLPEKSQYRVYSALQRKEYEAGLFKKDIEFYKKTISSDLQPIPLFSFSKLRTRRPQQDYKAHRSVIRLEPALSAKVKQVARQNHATNFHLYLAILQALVFRLLPDTNELFIGIADANRNKEDFMGTLGFFLNLLPIRFQRPSAKARFSAAVKAARTKVFEALEHNALPFDVLLSELGVSRSANAPPVFQIFMDYRLGTTERDELLGCKYESREWHQGRTAYDLSVDLLENADGGAEVTLELQQSLYTQEHADLLARAYVHLLKSFVASDITFETPTVWAPEDLNAALIAGKGPVRQLQWPQTVVHRIDNMIHQHGSRPALKDGRNRQLSYEQMGKRINSIADALIKAGIKPGDRVGVLQEPSAEWTCSQLAIMRAGATYMPLDLRNSVHRLHSAVKAAKPIAYIIDPTTKDTAKEIPNVENAIVIDVSTIEVNDSIKQHPNLADPEGVAVILFTSGSTGEPKGILIKHASLVAQDEGYSTQCDVANGGLSRVMQQSPFSFDFSLDQTFLCLNNGGCLYVVPAENRGDPFEITKLMRDEHITYTSGTPSEYKMWFQFAKDHLHACTSWKNAFTGGEAFTPEFVREFKELNIPGLQLFNNYGPGECTVSNTYWPEGKGIAYRDEKLQYPIPGGFSAPNFAMYVVDQKLNLQPVGVPGEIIIGGVGVTAGYLNNEAAMKAKFLENPFARNDAHFTSNGWTRMYRTGDRGHLRKDGGLIVHGRLDGDTQVKIRGFRIELGEVEKAIVDASNGALSHAVVTLREEDGDKYLAAHVVFNIQYPETGRIEFLDALQATLPVPNYMRPAAILPLDKLPLTSHNKVDRKAIAAMSIEYAGSAGPEVDREFNPTEAKLEQLWKTILPASATLRPITLETDFFHIGGSSLHLVKLQRLIKQEFLAAPKLIELLGATTLRDMAAVIATSLTGKLDWDVETAVPETWADDFPLAAAKKSRKASFGLSVLLTGATGYLGRNVVSALDKSAKVAQILCLVRKGTDTTALKQLSNKVSTYAGDLKEAGLGLSKAEFDHLAATADVILHSGAERSFWDDYEVLRAANVGSVKELARLAMPRRIPVHFMSSGAVRIYGTSDGPRIYNAPQDNAPSGETPPEDGTDGYVATKWAAERFLSNASTKYGLPVTFHAPAPIPGAGPAASHAEPESGKLLNELVEVTKRLGVRPSLEGLDGWTDLISLDLLVDDVVAAVLEDGQSETRKVYHNAETRTNFSRFKEECNTNKELNALPSMSTLEWIGDAKKAGLRYFMAAQRLVVETEQGSMVSRR